MMPLVYEKITNILIKLNNFAASRGKLTGFCIGNTSKANEAGFYLTPMRETSRLVICGAIVFTDEWAKEFAEVVDGKVNYILVDAEKKSLSVHLRRELSNVERVVREAVRESKIVTYKGNDVTVDAIDSFVAQVLAVYPRGVSGKKAGIIGAGNLGSKLALKLVERGMSVALFRRDSAKLTTIVEAINIIKPAGTLATASAAPDSLSAARGAHLLIGLTQGTAVITPQMVSALASDGVLIDGGKGCISANAIEQAFELKVPIYRANAQPAFWGQIETVMATEQNLMIGMGRTTFDGVSVVSGGLMAVAGEIVVDSIHNPNTIFGIADGFGDFINTPTPSQIKMLNRVRNYIKARE